MANVNFYGVEVQSDGTLGTEVIDNINSYMGKPVVDHYWKNDPDIATISNGTVTLVDTPSEEAFSCMKGSVKLDDPSKASFDWKNFETPIAVEKTNIYNNIYRGAIDNSNFGKPDTRISQPVIDVTTGLPKVDLSGNVVYPTDPSTIWQPATEAEIKTALEKRTGTESYSPLVGIKTVYRVEDLQGLSTEEDEVVALVMKGQYIYLKKIQTVESD